MANTKLDLVIESASDDTAVALASAGAILHRFAWHAHQSQSRTLLPNIERLLDDAGRTKEDVGAVLVDIGPGGYASLRVGLSIAKALAHGLGVPIAGVGRLELDAALVASGAGGRRIIAVHRAGRGDVAWAAYRTQSAGELAEELAPRIEAHDAWRAAIRADDVVTGDLDGALAALVRDAGASVAAPAQHRIDALASLGRRRLDAGGADDASALVPLYLRGPAIGPPKR